MTPLLEVLNEVMSYYHFNKRVVLEFRILLYLLNDRVRVEHNSIIHMSWPNRTRPFAPLAKNTLMIFTNRCHDYLLLSTKGTPSHPHLLVQIIPKLESQPPSPYSILFLIISHTRTSISNHTRFHYTNFKYIFFQFEQAN